MAGVSIDGFHKVVGGILVRDNRVLLCNRRPDRSWYPGVWDLVGGHVLPRETTREALARECHEELGITVLEVGDMVAATTTSEATLTVFVIHQWDGEPTNTAPDEHQAIGWFHAAQLTELPLTDPQLEDLLRQVLTAPDVTARHPPASSR